MSALGKRGLFSDAQALPNIGKRMVWARGSIDCRGLLRKPMKLGKSRLPVRNPAVSPSKLKRAEVEPSTNSSGAAGERVPGVDGARSWQTAADADETKPSAAKRMLRGRVRQVVIGELPCRATCQIQGRLN